MKLSELDKKIIYELGNNARIGYKELAQKINSKKTIIAYHIQNLIKAKVIWKFVPVFSINRLGFCGYKIYFRLHGINKQNKEEMIKDLVNDKVSTWVAETTGAWDLLIATYSSNILEFADKKDKIFKKYGKYIQEYSITILEDGLVFNKDYLVNKKLEYRKEFVFGGERKFEQIDNVQKQIIHQIKNDGRYQATQIAKDLNLNVRTVLSKISDLEKKKIIQGYTIFLDVNKVGLKFFKLCIYLQDFTSEKYNELLGFCKFHKNIIHIIKAIGDWELELEIEAENVEYIYSLIDDIKTNYPKIVKKIDVVIITKEHKLEFFPAEY
jgi:DNA-binding Lrp family transcriptional regulator